MSDWFSALDWWDICNLALVALFVALAIVSAGRDDAPDTLRRSRGER